MKTPNVADVGVRNQVSISQTLQPGAVPRRQVSKNSQAHPGVSPLNTINHRNTGFQGLPPPLGLPPYHYSLADNFAEIAQNIQNEKRMVFHVLGDSGGVKDAEFQDNVAAQMVKQLNPKGLTAPQFC